RAGAQVERSSQSNGGEPDREPTRIGRPRSVRRSATRRPVLPVPPRTRVVFSEFAVICPPVSELGLVTNWLGQWRDPALASPGTRARTAGAWRARPATPEPS